MTKAVISPGRRGHTFVGELRCQRRQIHTSGISGGVELREKKIEP